MFNWVLFFGPEVFQKLYEKEVIPCTGFFVVERSLVNTSLPKNALTPAELKGYIIHCRRVGGWKETSFSAGNDLLRRGGVRVPAKREAVIEGLKVKFFIEEMPSEEGRRRFRVLSVPLHNSETNEFLKSPFKRKISHMKADSGGYIQLPNELVDSNIIKHLNGRQIRVLIKLYEYNRMEIYGGVDPNVVSIKEHEGAASVSLESRALGARNPGVFVDSTLYSDLYLTESEFLASVRGLAQRGLLKLEERTIQLEGDRVIVSQTGEGGDKLFALRPVYQLRKHVETWEGKADD